MARGGYVKPEVAVRTLFKVTGARPAAKKRIVDALVSGQLSARGCQILEWQKNDSSPDSPHLKDLVVKLAEELPKLAPTADIPPSYWSGLPVPSDERWDWHEGQFWNSEKHKKDHWGYASVTLKEADVNTLASLLKPSDAPPTPIKERRPKADWEDWVAALATLASEGQINGNMLQREVLDLVTARLYDWGLEERKESTVAPTATAVLKRFGEIDRQTSES